MRKFLTIGIIGILAVIGGFFYESLPQVEVTQVKRGSAVQAVYATGTVEPTVMLPVAARVSARLMELNADEGQHVTEGQIMARLENTDLTHALQELHAKAKLAESEYNRRIKLGIGGFAAKETVEQAKTAWQAARAAEERAKAEAGYLQLTAPAEGIIIKRDGEIGQLIAVNQPVFWLSTGASLRITTEVDEEDIALVQPGQAVLIRADAFPNQIFHGKVQAITPKGDPVARSYRVRIELLEETPLMTGMTAETNIIIRETPDALLIPASAVEQDHAWVVIGGKAQERSVTTGAKGTNDIEILNGLQESDTVIVRHEAPLKEGASVRTRQCSNENLCAR